MEIKGLNFFFSDSLSAIEVASTIVHLIINGITEEDNKKRRRRDWLVVASHVKGYKGINSPSSIIHVITMISKNVRI